jgi:hypothetical protein
MSSTHIIFLKPDDSLFKLIMPDEAVAKLIADYELKGFVCVASTEQPDSTKATYTESENYSGYYLKTGATQYYTEDGNGNYVITNSPVDVTDNDYIGVYGDY